MKYYSTRGREFSVSFENVVLNGLASDGGLYVPEQFPVLNKKEISSLRDLNYAELAFQVTKYFIGDSIPLNKYERLCKKT